MPAAKKKRSKKKTTSSKAKLRQSAVTVAEEMEKVGEVLAEEVKETIEEFKKSIDIWGDRMVRATRNAMNEASSMSERLSDTDLGRLVEDSLKALGEGFDTLRGQLAEVTEGEPVKRGRKKASKKKSSKKKAGKKKASKKKSSKKKASKKKATRKKTGKKKASKKKTSKKKVVV